MVAPAQQGIISSHGNLPRSAHASGSPPAHSCFRSPRKTSVPRSDSHPFRLISNLCATVISVPDREPSAKPKSYRRDRIQSETRRTQGFPGAIEQHGRERHVRKYKTDVPQGAPHARARDGPNLALAQRKSSATCVSQMEPVTPYGDEGQKQARSQAFILGYKRARSKTPGLCYLTGTRMGAT